MSSNLMLAVALVFAVFLWGGNNTGTKFIVHSWPPIWTGSSRFLCAGLLLLGALRWTKWLGRPGVLSSDLKRRLWWKGGLSLAAYIVVFNTALRHATVSHVALYLGASPVWALLWEQRPARDWRTVQRYGAAALALVGVFILFWPALRQAHASWLGEALGLAASLLWTHYGRQCRRFGAELSGVETTAHTMWRAGLLLLPIGLAELARGGLPWPADLVLVQFYCILAGGVVAFGIWNHALRHWPASRVLLFNNLIPLSSMGWARVCLKEPITPTFGVSMLFVVSGVILGQTDWQKLLAPRSVPPE
jgi:drug/metabolite transporter (DMT)-like permease